MDADGRKAEKKTKSKNNDPRGIKYYTQMKEKKEKENIRHARVRERIRELARQD